MEDRLQPGVRFYVAPDNNKIGPLTEEVIREKVQSGEYPADLLAWKEGDAAWSSLAHYFPHLFLGTTPELSAVKSAPISDRALALIIDIVLFSIVMTIVAILFFATGIGVILDIFMPIFGPLLFPLYAACMLASSKRATLGMMMMHLKVVTMRGGVVDFKRALLRSALAAIIGAFFCITWLWAFWDEKSETLHDKFAGTLVVKE